MRRLPLIFLVVLCAAESTNAMQAEPDSLDAYFQFEDPSPLSCLLTYLPPLFIRHGMELKSFIRGRTFRRIKASRGDVRAVDAIFIRAMQLTNNNTAISLLLSTLACMDHDVVGIRLPVIQWAFPLSSEPRKDFYRRLANLPRYLYSDTPAGEDGDRDKLQHFFGSTFITFVFESRHSADRLGDFIEQGEEVMIVGGIRDDRDLRANRQGQDFGLALLENNRRLPSEFLQLPLAERMLLNTTCTGVW